jgi:hypothetical protein
MLLLFPLGFLVRPRRAADAARDRFVRIRCPLCGWEPQQHDLWACHPDGCGHAWNTFDTYGVCPNCHKQWEYTHCHRCAQWPPHDDWYERT